MMSEYAPQISINISSLPDISKAEMDFHDTSFFHPSSGRVPQLPSPTELLQRSPDRERNVVKFEHLNLVVKFGPPYYVRLEEAQAMVAMRQAFPNNEVPVPEVFGWRKHGHLNFIYMSLIPGKTLSEVWPTCTEKDKQRICDELGQIIISLRRLIKDTSDPWIGIILILL
jgi:hypothetical protein